MIYRARKSQRPEAFSTYFYFRVYHRGDVLGKHTDRQRQISHCLGQGEAWPLMVEDLGSSAVALAPGDVRSIAIEVHIGASSLKSTMLRFS